MVAPALENDSLRRCFLLAPRNVATDTLAKALADRGIECLRPDDLLRPGRFWSDELTHHLATTDFVVAIVPPAASGTSIGFELGLAHGLNKPALAIAVGNAAVPDDLRELVVLHIPSLDHLDQAFPDIDRFLRHTRRRVPAGVMVPLRTEPTNPEWHARLAQLRDAAPAERGLLLERLVADVFNRTGAEVRRMRQSVSGRDEGVDFVVWPDRLVYEIGGPLLVACKVYQGNASSIVKRARDEVHRLDEIIEQSDARLAALIVDHGRGIDARSLQDTPRVLVFSIEQLIDVVEGGSLLDEVLLRRRQAAYARGHAGVEYVQ